MTAHLARLHEVCFSWCMCTSHTVLQNGSEHTAKVIALHLRYADITLCATSLAPHLLELCAPDLLCGPRLLCAPDLCLTKHRYIIQLCSRSGRCE